MKSLPLDSQSQQNTQAVPLGHLLPDNTENKHFYKNGLSKLIPRLTLKVHSNLDQCYELWEKFSPKQGVFDNWGMRYAFYQGFKHKPHFYTISEGKKALGVLPLWFNSDEGKFEFFGGWWIEGNSFFVLDEHLVDFFSAVLPSPTNLWSIRHDQPLERLKLFGKVEVDKDPNFFKNIENVSSIDSLLRQYKKKDRHHLKADHQRMKNYGVRLEVVDSNMEEPLEILFAMANKRFMANDNKSVFQEEVYRTTFREIIKNAGDYEVKFLVAKIQNHVAAVDMIITYNDTYYQFQGANDTRRFNGIGNYMVYEELQDAINGNFKMIDCLQEDHSWKHHFFDSIERYNFVK